MQVMSAGSVCLIFVFPCKQALYLSLNKHNKDGFDLQLISLPSVCLTGRKAGLAGCRLLCDSVQTFRPSPHGPRSEQLQKVCSPQSVRHPQEPVHQHHAGRVQLKHGATYTEWHTLIALTFSLKQSKLNYEILSNQIICIKSDKTSHIEHKVQSLTKQ